MSSEAKSSKKRKYHEMTPMISDEESTYASAEGERPNGSGTKMRKLNEPVLYIQMTLETKPPQKQTYYCEICEIDHD